MRAVFTKYNDKTDAFEDIFSLTLTPDGLVPSNEVGTHFLRGLDSLSEFASNFKDAQLYRVGEYEKLLRFCAEKYHSPYLSARLEEGPR